MRRARARTNGTHPRTKTSVSSGVMPRGSKLVATSARAGNGARADMDDSAAASFEPGVVGRACCRAPTSWTAKCSMLWARGALGDSKGVHSRRASPKRTLCEKQGKGNTKGGIGPYGAAYATRIHSNAI
eukprot:scaffold7720_cov129-Isochrysis_galbana.AAC.3